jgi:hypothetical protein
MKVLFIKSNTHHKNLHFILNCKKIDFVIISSVNEMNQIDVNLFHVIISPCEPIVVSKYPNCKFIFGPHFSVFPENTLMQIKGNNSLYNSLSDWVVELWKSFPICNDLKIVALPFGIDTLRFNKQKEMKDRNKIMVYFKHRNPKELHMICSFLKYKHLEYKVFSYDNRYNEEEYIDYLHNAKFGIWIDAHESQGFALQECLSCDVPLLVWNVTTMEQEHGSNYPHIKATTIPYWDNLCGNVFYQIAELEDAYNHFITNIENYRPRDFIKNHLSIEVCENKWIDFIENM